MNLECEFEISAGPGPHLKAEFKMGGRMSGLFGPSGSGKTTFFNALVGLIKPQRGKIFFEDFCAFDSEKRIFCPPETRGIGYVFQESRLFPHLTVRENVFFGKKTGPAKIKDDQILDLLQLHPLLDRFPLGLSGGEKQRVSLGRALLCAPRFLLLDEPLSALDATAKEQLLPFLRRVRNEIDIPLIYVSHYLGEILQLTDDILFIENGKTLPYGPYQDLIKHPSVFRLIKNFGIENILRVKILSSPGNPFLGHLKGECFLETGPSKGEITLNCEENYPVGTKLFLHLNGDEILITKDPLPVPHSNNQLKRHLLDIVEFGSDVLLETGPLPSLYLTISTQELKNLSLEKGGTIYLHFSQRSLKIRDVCFCPPGSVS